MEKYLTLEMEVIELERVEIVTISGGGQQGGFGLDDDTDH